MSQKDNSQQQNSDKNQEQIKSRRTLLKNAIASGAIVGGSALATGWHKPIINSVILPVHATTSMPQGDFTAAGVMPMALLNSPSNSVQYALLNSLISPANAGHLINSTCNNDDDSTGNNDGDGLISIHFRITGTDVEIALSVVDNQLDNPQFDCSGGTSTLSATNSIADVTNIDITNYAEISLTNMQATATQVTGTWNAFDSDSNNNNPTCDNTFTASIGGTFPDNDVCESMS